GTGTTTWHEEDAPDAYAPPHERSRLSDYQRHTDAAVRRLLRATCAHSWPETRIPPPPRGQTCAHHHGGMCMLLHRRFLRSGAPLGPTLPELLPWVHGRCPRASLLRLALPWRTRCTGHATRGTAVRSLLRPRTLRPMLFGLAWCGLWASGAT